MTNHLRSRRSFLAMGALLPWALRGTAAFAASTIPVGLEMYSVRDALSKDPVGTVRAVAEMGYQGLSFMRHILIGAQRRRKTCGSCWTI